MNRKRQFYSLPRIGLDQVKEKISSASRSRSGQLVTATTKEKTDKIKELTCCQDDEPGLHFLVLKIAPHTEAPKSSVHQMVKKHNLNSFRRVSTPQLTTECRTRQIQCFSNHQNYFQMYSLP